MGRHQVFYRLARYVNVVWVEPPRGWRSVLQEFGQRRTVEQQSQDPAGFTVYRHENWLPELYRPRILANWTHDQRIKRARKLLTRQGCQRILLSLWSPQYASALHAIPHDLSSYHIFDEHTYSDVSRSVAPEEVELIESVDQVFVQSKGLMERKGAINANTLLLPNGVDYSSLSGRHAEPADLKNIPRPIIGYSGYVKRQLDWELIDRLTAHHSEWSFVFAGAAKVDPSLTQILHDLTQRPNVYFLGAKSSQELVAYPPHFDVCIMPYRVNAYTHCIYPLKLHEYLASGKPVVGSSIRTLQDFAEVLAIPTDHGTWSTAISDALSPARNTPAQVRKRQAVAQTHDWGQITAKMLRTLAQRLFEKTGDPLLEMLDMERGEIAD